MRPICGKGPACVETVLRSALRWGGWTTMTHVRRILLAWPRGYCAGVERAVDTVERALRMYGVPGLRSKADRPQPARGGRPGGAGRHLRRRRG